MRNTIGRPGGLVSLSYSRRRRRRFPRLVPLFVVGLGLWAGVSAWQRQSSLPASTGTASQPIPLASAARYHPLLDPAFSLGPAPLTLGRSAPLAQWRSAAPTEIAALPPAVAREPEPPASLPLPPLSPPSVVQLAPLPLPRPQGLQAPAAPQVPAAAQAPATTTAEAPRVAVPRSLRRTKTVAAPAVQEDNRSFFEKLFGVQRSSGPALAYASATPGDDIIDSGRGRRLSPSLPSSSTTSAGTAVYDISARMVYMPNGDRLEAHSGLGEKMDDIRFAHVRMQGVTPPHVYNLTEREALFHGHRALRLNPVGGSGAIHGRAGLLAHPYLLGPRGDSNGCVSFRDYEKFLQAFLRGEVRRLVVVEKMG
jgi:hypothetical protein